MQIHNGVRHKGAQRLGGGLQFFEHGRALEGGKSVSGEDHVVFSDANSQLLSENFRVHQVCHAQSHACDFVAVSRADAPLGGADLATAFGQFTRFVQLPVVGQHQMGGITDHQVLRRHDNAFGAQPFDLSRHGHRIQHHPVANHAEGSGPQNPRGNEVQHVFCATHDDGVSSVVAALTAYDDLSVVGEEIDDFSFAFVAPLGADENGIGHKCGWVGCRYRWGQRNAVTHHV